MIRARLLGSFVAGLLLPLTALVAPAASAADISPRVVNGREPLGAEVRSLVYVRAGGSVCSGTLVDVTHVITAGHCAFGRSPGSISVGWTPTGVLPVTTWAPVISAAVHPDYDNTTFVNDIAVLTLTIPLLGAEPMPLGSPALARASLKDGASVASAGFGYTSSRGPLSDRARVADLTVLPDRVCAADGATYVIGEVTFTGLGVDTATALCAIGVVPQSSLIIDTCQGDSGGPLFVDTARGARLLGLVSGGVGCAGFEGGTELKAKTPGVYTRIAPYLTWLAGIGVRSAPAVPTITAQSAGADGIAVTFAPGDASIPSGYRAVATGADGASECSTAAGATTCTITGLAPGARYSVVGFAQGGTSESSASAPVSAVAGVPSARPGKPRIDAVKVTPDKRLAVTVSRADSFAWTTTVVICRSADRTFRGDVRDGKAVLSLPSRQTYRCYAKSANPLGGTRSKAILIDM